MAVAHRTIGRCPVCNDDLEVRRLECVNCGTAVEGRFVQSRFDRLSPEQQEFVEVFLLSRGNIKEVERVLGISYPTVRNRLDAVLEAMGHKVERDSGGERRAQILAALDRGEITAAEAIKMLKG
ncbi:MAG: DUF2089 domain-containing protein [Firmicutes bacterium]|nr:DUF2089 domain-containing protein [Bacillota bacterium]